MTLHKYWVETFVLETEESYIFFLAVNGYSADKYLVVIEHVHSSPWLQKPSGGPHPEPVQSISSSQSVLYEHHFNIFFSSTPRFPK
jgi:hypothetical protein